jgi:hypothetical protein
MSDRLVERLPFRQSQATTTEPVDGVLRRPISYAEAQAAARERVQPLYRLEPGWDSYGARPIDPTIGEVAEEFLTQIAADNLVPLPVVVPKSAGGLALEWHHHARELAIELTQHSVVVYYFNPDSGQEWERNARELQPHDLVEAFAAITREG